MPVPGVRGRGGRGGGAAAGPLSNGTARAVTERSGPECGEGERGLRGRVPSPALSSGPGRYAVPSVPSGAGGAPTPPPLGAGGTQGVLSPPPTPSGSAVPSAALSPSRGFGAPRERHSPAGTAAPKPKRSRGRHRPQCRRPPGSVQSAALPGPGQRPPRTPRAGRGCVGRAAPSEQLSGTQKPLLAR